MAIDKPSNLYYEDITIAHKKSLEFLDITKDHKKSQGIYIKPFKPYKEEYMEWILLGVLAICVITIWINVWFDRM